ncbi:glutamate-5-semialdehyde dehydrogenase [Streptomyces olivaceus]|uniref:glutamate-5-semialdehyde dehydrogenase n=1 Tax=Streptomyces olivaceus TaxID=47716 RepID=UPI00363919C9
MTDQMLEQVRAALRAAPPIGSAAYLRYCDELAAALRREWKTVREANEADLRAMRAQGQSDVLVERVRLADPQLDAVLTLIDSVRQVLLEPQESAEIGPLRARRIRKPLGVVFMIYEARPTVTVEGALLPVVLGNAVILRGGKEISATNRALAPVVADALQAAGLPESMVTILDDIDRSRLRALLKRPDAIDVVLPRGGPSLVDFCRRGSTIPVIASGGGVNHLYVHASADIGLAARIVLDSKLPEPTACNTLETVLCDDAVLSTVVESVIAEAMAQQQSCTLKLPVANLVPNTEFVTLTTLTEHDRGREFLDRTIAIRPVAGFDEAVDYVRANGSGHTEGVVATDREVVGQFCSRVDAAAIICNGSLRLHDGPTMGLGPEISISTGRLHVRGPVALDALTTSAWVINADGALREKPGHQGRN